MGKMLAAWNRFFFEPTSPIPMCIFRILVGLLLLTTTLVHLIPDMATWFGPAGTASPQTACDWCLGDIPRFNLLVLAPSENRYFEMIWCLALASLLLTIGLATRFSAVVIFLILISLRHHNPAIGDFFTDMLQMSVFYLIWSNAGSALSVDSLLQRFRRGWDKGLEQNLLYPPWAQRLVQLQLSIIYLESALTKLMGKLWIDGTAIYYTSRNDYFSGFDIPYVFDHIWSVKVLTYATIGLELALGTLIWLKPLRYWVILLGIIFHISLDLAMNLPLLQWLYIFSYIVFIDPGDLSSIAKKAQRILLAMCGTGLSSKSSNDANDIVHGA